jgi:hypothetical protein
MPNRTLEGLDEEKEMVVEVVVRKVDSYRPYPYLRNSEHSLNLALN